MSFPDRAKSRRALAKLKFLVVMDPLDTETSRFWQDFGPHNHVRSRSDPDRGVRAADDLLRRGEGSLINSARWMQWHWKAADRPGEAQPDIGIMTGIFQRMREMYARKAALSPIRS